MSALAAVVRRDLRGASRAGLPAWARLASLALVGTVALAALARLGPGRADDVSAWFAACVLGVMGLCLAAALPASIGAFRAERDSGTLDLLLLSGLSPARLALGRTISTFLVLESIAAAALPGFALFWFFRTPGPAEALVHLLAITCFNAALAAAAVAISAHARSTGSALAAGLVLLPGFGLVSLRGGGGSAASLVQGLAAGGGAPAGQVALVVVLHGALAAAALLLARIGLDGAAGGAKPPAARSSLPPRRARAHRPPGGRPLTWLLMRTSPPARPWVQLAASVPLLLLVAVVPTMLPGALSAQGLEPALLSAAGGSAGLVAVAVAVAVGATRIASERERRAWDAIASTARTSELLLLDLLNATMTACALPFALGAVLLLLADVVRGLPLFEAMLGTASLFASLLLAASLGLAASACVQRGAAALALATVLLLGLPALVALLLLAGTGGLSSAVLGWTVLVGALTVLALPFLVRGLGPFVLLLLASLRESRRSRRGPGPGSLILRPVLVLAPLALVVGLLVESEEGVWALAFGGLHAALAHCATFGEDRRLLEPDLLVSGAWWQLLFAALVLAGLHRHRDAWLGRAAR